MITDTKTVKAADAFVKSYEPAAADHPELASRVANYRATVESGSAPARQIHARTLMRFVDNTRGLAERQVEGSDGEQQEPEQLKGAALDEALEAAGLSKSGTADEKRERLAEHQANGG